MSYSSLIVKKMISKFRTCFLSSFKVRSKGHSIIVVHCQKKTLKKLKDIKMRVHFFVDQALSQSSTFVLTKRSWHIRVDLVCKLLYAKPFRNIDLLSLKRFWIFTSVILLQERERKMEKMQVMLKKIRPTPKQTKVNIIVVFAKKKLKLPACAGFCKYVCCLFAVSFLCCMYAKMKHKCSL